MLLYATGKIQVREPTEDGSVGLSASPGRSLFPLGKKIPYRTYRLYRVNGLFAACGWWPSLIFLILSLLSLSLLCAIFRRRLLTLAIDESNSNNPSQSCYLLVGKSIGIVWPRPTEKKQKKL